MSNYPLLDAPAPAVAPDPFEPMSVPITEQRVCDIVAAWTRPGSSLRVALDLHAATTEGHLAYAAFAHLGLVAGLVGHTAGSRGVFPGTAMAGNLWVLLVGRSASSRKTTSLQLQADEAVAVAPDRFLDRPGSAEAFYRQLSEGPNRCLYLPEGGDFFAQVQRGKLAALNEGLVKLYDGKSERIRYVKGEIRVDKPRLSLLGAISPAFLTAHTTPQDWRGGFFSRMLVIVASPERELHRPGRDEGLQARLRASFTQIDADQHRICPPAGMTDAADALWSEWHREIQRRSRAWSHHEALSSIFGRASMQTAKLSLLLAAIDGASHDAGWLLDAPLLSLAVALADLHLRSAVACASVAFETTDARDKATVLDLLSASRHPLLLGEVCRRSGLLTDRAVRILMTLHAQGDAFQDDRGAWGTKKPRPVSGAGDLRSLLL